MFSIVLKICLLSVFYSYALSKKPNSHEVLISVLNGKSNSTAAENMKLKVLKNFDENLVFENSNDKQRIIDERSTIFIHNSKYKNPRLNQLCVDTAKHKNYNVLHKKFIKELLYAPDANIEGFIDPYETSHKANKGADLLAASEIIQNVIDKADDIEREYFSEESKSAPSKPAYTKRINNNLLLYKLQNKIGSKIEVPVILNDGGILSPIPTYSKLMKYSQKIHSPFFLMPGVREYKKKTRTYAGPIDANLLYASVLNTGQKEKKVEMKVRIPMLNYNTPQMFNANGEVEVPKSKESDSQQNVLELPKIEKYIVKQNEVYPPQLKVYSATPECRYYICNIVKASESLKIMLECKCKQNNANSNHINVQKLTYKINLSKKDDRSASSPEHDYTTMLHDLESALNEEEIHKK